MKILYITTIGDTMGFFQSIVKELLGAGNIVDLAANPNIGTLPGCFCAWGCRIYPLSCTRSPLDKNNLKAIREIRKIVSEGHYDIVHCHTPIAAMCTRIACRKLRKNGLKVFYTAHGFHFYQGAPLKNWLLYYPVEWLCAHWTDVLITINREDYARAKKHLHARRVEYVPGVGLDVSKFADAVADRVAKRREIRVPENAFLLLSVGELNGNKNHETVLRALAKLGNENIHYAIAGEGELKKYLSDTAKSLGVEERLHLLGQRSDVPELYKAADAYVHPSFREGLPVSVMEAMASGLPCILSRIRGSVDLASEKDILCDPHSADEFADAMKRFCHALPPKRDTEAVQTFSVDVVNRKMRHIYGL